MENLTHIYLAFNQDCDRAPQATTPTATPIPSAWAAPITQTDHPSASTYPTSTVQDADVDFEAYSYPSFYL